MEIANFFKKIFDFTYKRIIEFLALILLIFAILIFLALFSYSTSDPNFIFPDSLEINNWLGYRGSIISDIFLQSIGLISFIIPISYFFISLAIFSEKKLEKLIECTFYIILYSVTGSFFFSLYFNDSFWLPINGNGGFVGNYLSKTTFLNII